MRDGPFRAAVKGLARARFWIDLSAARAWRRRREGEWFELAGECRRCAQCCESPSIRANTLVWHLRSARYVFLWWQRVVNGFVLVRQEKESRAFVFTCTHFDERARSCDSYFSRPGLCRDYPRALLEQPEPEFLPGCGYRPRAPGSRRFLTVLEGYPLTEEQKARLREGLHLE